AAGDSAHRQHRVLGGAHERIPELVSGGLPVVLSQTFRTLIHSRLELGMKGYEASHPDTDIVLFEPDQRRWRREAPDYYPRRVEAQGERAGRLVFNPRTPQLDLIRLGDRIVLNKRTNSTIKIYDGEDISIRGVTLLAGPGVGVIARYLRGDNRFTLDIRPGPPPPGATQPRLMSTCADGLNYAYADRGPRIEDCHFSFMGDDSINLHGTVMPVVACPTPTELLVAWPYGPESLAKVLLPGGRARRLQAPNFAIAGEAVITGFAREPALTEQATRRVAEVWPRNPAGRGTLWRLTLATPLPCLPGEFVDFPETAAPGYRIAGCTFEDHRGHALRIMASRGVIEQNVMRRIKYAGVAIGAEYGFWREAGWVDEVVIRGNRIEDVTLSPRLREPQSLNLGAISVYARPERFGPDLTLFAGHRRIVIEDNVIDGSALAGIHVAAAREVTIRNNVLKRTNYATAPDAGREAGQRLTGPIETSGVPDAVVENNLIQELGQAYRE
ncbi:MAG: right-handed parallel beta-helix repeat-containing protein, partial [Armatimonadetes bacterium]|nr:right-handed parallel beta-helix repeat-containing protein [Armatimonadota bacterium]